LSLCQLGYGFGYLFRAALSISCQPRLAVEMSGASGMLYRDDPHSYVRESDGLRESVVVFFEVNVPVKRHRDIA